MLVGCLWQNDNLVTVSLGGTLTVFSATDPDKVPVSYSGHMKNISSLACILQSGQKVILSSSYDGIISRWIQGIGYVGKLVRKDTTQIKCFAALDEEIVTSAFDNKVSILLTMCFCYWFEIGFCFSYIVISGYLVCLSRLTLLS